jgi:23S rRNA (cytosine1962-C5)-methyltransferase
VSFDLPAILDGEDKSSILKNRIRNNFKHVKKWAKRSHTNCFRIYDWQIPSYALSIDYWDGKISINYFSKTKDSPDPPHIVKEDAVKALKDLLDIDPDKIYWRSRIKRSKLEQYEKHGDDKEFFVVLEYGVKFLVNLSDYLDVGLFLDHRETRKLVRDLSKDKKVLNLFAYTSSFGVQAAAGGAKLTKNVDMSNTYCAWSNDNFAINGFSALKNAVIRADCLKFLEDEFKTRNRYDIIVIDPPTISRSKKMNDIFDIQKDFEFLIKKALVLLEPNGIIFFSTNSRKFEMDASLFSGIKILEITKKTIPLDFHDPKIHRCWKISKEAL